jgi:GH15 family glucan-1,4-alpha-glucosidase
MGEYPDISDHGLIGDLQTAALVDTNGTIDWFCFPRFDSPSVFASLLDGERGGFCRIAPDTSDFVTRQLYLPETAILVTRYMTEEGVGEVVDFMPVAEDRRPIAIASSACFASSAARCGSWRDPSRFDYGRAMHTIHPRTSEWCSRPTTPPSRCTGSAPRSNAEESVQRRSSGSETASGCTSRFMRESPPA